jgi:BirA family biotin operon repressor/biotin-[acetyl-CoA-carboxylase] ligase
MSAVRPPVPFDEPAIAAALAPGAFGRPLRFYDSVDSTNARAADLARAGAPEGTAVIADEQTAGRGRGERRWISPRGCGIYLSVVVRPGIAAGPAMFLTSLAALAVAEVAADAARRPARIKWPNDVVLGGRKIAGILAERAGGGRNAWVVLGIGLNVNHRRTDFPAAFREKATSLRIETGREHPRVNLAVRLLERLEDDYRRFLAQGAGPFLDRLRDGSVVLGHRVEIEDGRRRVQGIALDFDVSGGLVLGRGSGRETFTNGSVRRIW